MTLFKDTDAESVNHVVHALADQWMLIPSEIVNCAAQMHRKVIEAKREVTC